MKANHTKIIFLLDNSGSMMGMGSEPIDGFNDFIKTQQDPTLGTADVTLKLFGTQIETVYTDIDIQAVPVLTNKEYVAHGMTCLRDAIGSASDAVGQQLASLSEDERPSKVIIAILTDGDDTSSITYSTAAIQKIIDEQTNTYSWEYLFMGTTAASITAAQSYNISGNSTFAFDNNSRGLSDAYATTASLVTRSRGGADMTLQSTLVAKS